MNKINGVELSESAMHWLVGFFSRVRTGVASHVKYMSDNTVFAIGAQELQVIFPNNYASIRDALFQKVSDDYWYAGPETASDKKGYTKAYKFRPETVAALKEYKVVPQADGPGCFKEKFNRKVLSDLCSLSSLFKNTEDFVISSIYLHASVDNGDGTGNCFVKYRRTYSGGREFACGPSLQTLPKYVRQQIMFDSTDIDMVNAHPTIMSALYKHMTGATLPVLEDYASINREKILSDVADFHRCSRDAAKQQVLMVSYGASLVKNAPAFTNWLSKNCGHLSVEELYEGNGHRLSPFIKAYAEELKVLNQTIYDKHPLAKGMGGSKASIAAKIVQTYEAAILSVMQAFFVTKGIAIETLMFDGLLVGGFVNELMLRELEGHIRSWSIGTYGFELPIVLAKKYYK